MASSAAAPALVAPGTTRVGFIGTGIMGASMAGHALTSGYSVAVHTRTPAKAAPLVERGATLLASPAEVAASADVLCVMVGYPADVREVLLGPGGALAALRSGSTVIDFTTSTPELAREVAAAAAQQGCFALDAPVSGGDAGARNATLTIMCGGDAATLAAVTPLLRVLGTPHFLGAPGAGQSCKAANQITIATTSACCFSRARACALTRDLSHQLLTRRCLVWLPQ
jgi:3-hydroxyisobutyrate dehydrogenase-like beta-hydroxyacid dehydrogenase